MIRIHWLKLFGQVGAIALGIAFWALLALALAGCGDHPAPRGSLQDQAVESTARAGVDRKAADKARVDAAVADADAAAAKRHAQEAKEQAELLRTDAAIQSAAKAEVERVRTEDAAERAHAVANALESVAKQADAEAADKADKARDERIAEAKAADERHWQNLMRWTGTILIVLGALGGGVLAYLTKRPMVGGRAALLLGGTGILVLTLGATIHWLPLVGVAALVAVAAEWAIHHHRANGKTTT